ncbi:MAG: N-acetyl-anhydromuranmyl-L-alanine amidase [Proteobacteria bacterium]|nr:N-acetyl-anhydromuranmyl-L-alanine amidase [Pseudomonadota bacterium]
MRDVLRRDGLPLRVDPVTGLVEGVHFVPSPNCDERPPGCDLELVVVHNISLPPGEYGGPWIERLFTNALAGTEHPYFEDIRGLRVSAHLLIRRDGSLMQFVPLGLRAWHAGESSWRGRSRCNDFSVGVELEGADDVPYEDRQYTTLSALVAALVDVYPGIRPDSVTGHSDIAPGRKTDPGPAFDWPRLHALVRQRLAVPGQDLRA